METYEERLTRLLNNQHVRRQRPFQSEIERRQRQFSTATRGIIEEAVARTNRIFEQRDEEFRLDDASGEFTGPHHIGPRPIVYRLRRSDEVYSEPLVIELTKDHMVTAIFNRYVPAVMSNFGWTPVAIDKFAQVDAEELLYRYILATITPSR